MSSCTLLGTPFEASEYNLRRARLRARFARRRRAAARAARARPRLLLSDWFKIIASEKETSRCVPLFCQLNCSNEQQNN
jgi:hypothetical protein